MESQARQETEETVVSSDLEESEASASGSIDRVDTFLKRRERQRLATKRLWLSGLVSGGIIAGLQVLSMHGVLPETGKDAAMSTVAVLFGLANSARS